jgi:hypothetical protein
MFGTKIISTYIANSGVLFQHKDKKILVDGVHTKQCNLITMWMRIYWKRWC